jgi:Cys-rich repeat protein
MYCVGCVQSTDCPAGDMHICDTSDGTCIGCLQDADCTTAPRLKCSPAQACVQCITTADCPTGHSCQFGTCR